MAVDVCLVDFAIRAVQVTHDEFVRVITGVELLKIHANVYPGNALEEVVVLLHEVAHDGSCVVEIAIAVDKS